MAGTTLLSFRLILSLRAGLYIFSDRPKQNVITNNNFYG